LFFSFFFRFLHTHIQEQSRHTSQEETIAIEWIVKAQFSWFFLFFHAFLSNEHRVLQYDDDNDDNAQAYA
jgi:hypothetical protein